RGKISRTESVDQQMHAYAPRRRPRKGIRNEAARLVILEDIALEEDLLVRFIKSLHQGGEIALAVLQQLEPVSADVLHGATDDPARRSPPGGRKASTRACPDGRAIARP